MGKVVIWSGSGGGCWGGDGFQVKAGLVHNLKVVFVQVICKDGWHTTGSRRGQCLLQRVVRAGAA